MIPVFIGFGPVKARELPIQISLERGSVLPHKPPACGRAEIL